MIQITCPICHAELDLDELKNVRAAFYCPNCKKKLQLEQRVLPFALVLPENDPAQNRFSCPFCEQHYTSSPDWNSPVLRCQTCGKEFLTPGLSPENTVSPQPPPPWAGMSKPVRPSAPPAKLPVGYCIVLGALLLAVIIFGVLYLKTL